MGEVAREARPPRATYLLPIRATSPPAAELTAYLRQLARTCDVLVVDGSPPEVFAAAHEAWGGFARHVAPDPAIACANGKVRGVLTGLALVSTPAVVIADDDVRYDDATLVACIAALDAGADVVRPQNYFDPLPWHARWDTGRTLLNRMTGGDFPGTLVVRTEMLRRTGGYDGDVLFENLELMRTVEAAGGRCVSRPDLFVRRLPPTTRHFLGQRVRQAYDELARPGRLAVTLAVLPATAAAVAAGRHRAVLAAGLAVAAVAEAGRRRGGGRQVLPASSSLLAPLWVLERAVTGWLAVAHRLRGGIGYGDGRLVVAATSRRELARRAARRRSLTPARPAPSPATAAAPRPAPPPSAPAVSASTRSSG